MEARLDKWLWAARIYKTRTMAADACKNGRIAINGAQAKASRSVKAGDEVSVRKPPVTYTFRVLQPIEKRVGAKLLPDILENITPPEQYEVIEELIPEASTGEHSNVSTIGFAIGFVLMMILDVVLGS